MKNKIKILSGILLILGIFYLIFIPITKPINKFKNIELEQNNIIINQTDKPYLDTILHVGLKHLKIKETIILIKDLNDVDFEKNNDGLITEAFIIGDGKRFIIYIDNFNRLKSMIVLAHELIHLEQYHDGRIIDYDDEMVWDNMMYTDQEIKDIYYFNRPWEKEAFDNQDELNKKIKNDLY
jgi:hypothetical protein